MTVTQLISAHNLMPADAVELVCPTAGFPKHYAVYLGIRNGVPKFIANITDGVQILSSKKLIEFLKRYQITNVERFKGDFNQRKNAVKRAISRKGERAYSIVFNNCEHFKNWVLKGEDISRQTTLVGTGIALAGSGIYLLGIASENKGLKRTGLVILSTLLIILIIAFLLWQYNPDKNDNLSN